MEKITHKAKKYNGYTYRTVQISSIPTIFSYDHWINGYVKVPKSHFLHDVDYLDENEELVAMDFSCPNPIDVFEVHGGITFSGYLSDENGSNAGFHYGFDTAHYGDNPIICDREYVEQECKNLIDQLINIQEAYELMKEKGI